MDGGPEVQAILFLGVKPVNPARRPSEDDRSGVIGKCAGR
jgi:hypothetical protein